MKKTSPTASESQSRDCPVRGRLTEDWYDSLQTTHHPTGFPLLLRPNGGVCAFITGASSFPVLPVGWTAGHASEEMPPEGLLSVGRENWQWRRWQNRLKGQITSKDWITGESLGVIVLSKLRRRRWWKGNGYWKLISRPLSAYFSLRSLKAAF